MTIQAYVVDKSNPISIYPAGLQNTVTVNNNGTNTIYLSDVNSGLYGWPLAAGNAMLWKAHTPLYARCILGFPSSLLVMDTGEVLPFSQVGLSGPIALQGVATTISNTPFPLNTPTQYPGMGAYASVNFSLTPKIGVVNFGGGTLIISWLDNTGTFTISKDVVTFNDLVNVADGVYSLTLTVKSDLMVVDCIYNNGPLVNSVITGLTATLPERYDMPGDGLTVNNGNADGITINLATSTQAVWNPRLVSGHATLSVFPLGATNSGTGMRISMYDSATIPNILVKQTVFAIVLYTALLIPIIIPRKTCRFQLANDTGNTMDVQLGLTMLGY